VGAIRKRRSKSVLIDPPRFKRSKRPSSALGGVGKVTVHGGFNDITRRRRQVSNIIISMSYVHELNERGVEARFTPFSSEHYTCEAVSKDLGIPIAEVGKAMVAIATSGLIVIAVLPGDRRLNEKKLRTHLSLAKGELRMAVPDEIHAGLGVEVGAVTPLLALHREGIRVVFDQRLSEQREINLSTGDLRVGLAVRPRKLIVALAISVADISRG
jgi:Cys-tRNA(Pro)/Cys-tRNA(Cys) deacylase